MVHALEEQQAAIDATHAGLGGLAAFATLTAKAKEALLIVASSGTGKSRVLDYIEKNVPGSISWRVGTVAGLSAYQDELTKFRAVAIIDDLAAMGSGYRREHTMLIFADLVYSHKIRIDTGQQNLLIEDFQGSCMIGCQPIVMRDMVKTGAWDGHLHDKTIRYYHLFRPLAPNLKPIETDYPVGVDIETVDEVDFSDELYGRFLRYMRGQWSIARTMEHCSKLLRGAAAIDGRSEVSRDDIRAVSKLSRALLVEQHLLHRPDFEKPRVLRNDIYYILSEFATYGHLSLAQLMENYDVSETSARRICDNHKWAWQMESKSPQKLIPSEQCRIILEQVAGWPKIERTSA